MFQSVHRHRRKEKERNTFRLTANWEWRCGSLSVTVLVFLNEHLDEDYLCGESVRPKLTSASDRGCNGI